MDYRPLGRSDLRISTLTLGTMMFADQTDRDTAARIVAHALDHGVNSIDTADVYSKGGSETLVGELIRARRDDWVLATKVGNVMNPAPNHSRYSRKWLMQACDASLKRLGTDYIDLYYLHRDFEDNDLDHAILALGDLVRAGKIRHFGLSNFRGYRIVEVVARCKALGVPEPVVCQPYYNLLNRMPEVEVLPACQRHGLGVASYSPIARGVLTAKYRAGVAPEAGSRAARGDRRMMQTEFREESFAIAERLKQELAGRGIALSHFAVAWILANRNITSVIAGPRTFEQWEDYFGALQVTVTAADEALVDSLVRPGHPSTPGYNDPQYPIIGRRV